MSRLTSSMPLSDSLLEEASSWFIDSNEGELDAQGRAELNQWLRRSPEHVRAYIEVAAAWDDSIRLRTALDAEGLIAEAASTERNIFALNVSVPKRQSPNPRSSAARRLKLLAFAAAILLTIFGIWIHGRGGTYATDIGEQRTLTLPDSSTVVINSKSRLKVRFSESERLVQLLDGQALFQVKRDPARPFVVASSGTRVRAVGTQFDVYRRGSGVTVTVLEGRVAVFPVDAREPTNSRPPKTGVNPATARSSVANSQVFLAAGEQLTVTARAAPRPVRVDMVAATAWTRRKLVFDETPLMEVAAEFNRYNSRQLVIQDPTLAEFHIRGNFQATDPDRLVQFLHERFGVRVEELDGEIRISKN